MATTLLPRACGETQGLRPSDRRWQGRFRRIDWQEDGIEVEGMWHQRPRHHFEPAR